MASLTDAFQRLQDDKALATAFMKDPDGTLKRLQVDTRDVDINQVVGSPPAKPGEVSKAVSVCWSAGVKGVCATVGTVVVIDNVVNAPPNDPVAPR